jgi:hypothetical protein
MSFTSRSVVTVKKGHEITSLQGQPLEHGDRLLIESKTPDAISLCFYRGGDFHNVQFDLSGTHSPLPLMASSPLPVPAELEGWSVRECTVLSELSQETLNYQMTLAYEGLPAVHAKNSGHGGADFIIGIGTRGSKHKLLDALQQLFSRIKSEGLLSPEDAALIEANDELFMEVFIEPLRRGYYLIHPLGQCVAIVARNVAAAMRQ